MSSTELYAHLEREHFKCHLCPEDLHRYFQRYETLEAHFKQKHHLCQERECLANRFIVFATEEEYQEHAFTQHGIQHTPLVFNFVHRRQNSNPYEGSSWTIDEGAQPPALEQQEAFPALPTRTTNEPRIQPPPSWTTNARVRAKAAPVVNRNEETEAKLRAFEPQIERNRRLADALGLGVNSNRELPVPMYSQELVQWARRNLNQIQSIERRIAHMLSDPHGTSVQLKPMKREQRAFMHELAEFYHLHSESFDREPKRYISFVRQADSRIPLVTLAQAAKQPGRQVRPPRPMPLIGAPKGGPNRGWETLRVAKPDAWGDDVEEEEKQCRREVATLLEQRGAVVRENCRYIKFP